MRKIRNSKEHADDCRRLARRLKGEQRAMMEKMAETWEMLARDREKFLRRHPECMEDEKALS